MIYSSKLSKKYVILALAAVVVALGVVLVIYPSFYFSLRYKIFPPKDYKQCIKAGGAWWDDNTDNGPSEPRLEDGPNYCSINGKTFIGGGWGNF